VMDAGTGDVWDVVRGSPRLVRCCCRVECCLGSATCCCHLLTAMAGALEPKRPVSPSPRVAASADPNCSVQPT
jgi:hypothetical protein